MSKIDDIATALQAAIGHLRQAVAHATAAHDGAEEISNLGQATEITVLVERADRVIAGVDRLTTILITGMGMTQELEHHSYDVPDIHTPITDGNPAYLSWLTAETHPQEPSASTGVRDDPLVEFCQHGNVIGVARTAVTVSATVHCVGNRHRAVAGTVAGRGERRCG